LTFFCIDFLLGDDIPVRCHVLLMHFTCFLVNVAVEDRNDEECEDRTACQTADYDNTHGGDHFSAFADAHGKRQHAECCCERCNHDWTETVLHTHLKSLQCRIALFFLLVRIVNQQDGVVHDNAKQHYDSDE